MSAAAVERFRAFNRFYTGVVGALDDLCLKREGTLPNAILFTNLHRDDVPKTDGCWPVRAFRLPPPPPPPPPTPS